MGMLHQLNQWSITHHPRWLVILRVALGLCLLLKGILFISNAVVLQRVLEVNNLPSGEALSAAIAVVHLLGGILLIPGLLTRWAAGAQIPILIVAVFFVNVRRGVFAAESEFSFSLIVLIMLVFFTVEGGGPLSLDDYFRKNPK
ncbi:MAG: DoxX family protein [Chitinophagaceae bacterium]|nr:DoxX family protein [Chitinophagaceae bacterium]